MNKGIGIWLKDNVVTIGIMVGLVLLAVGGTYLSIQYIGDRPAGQAQSFSRGQAPTEQVAARSADASRQSTPDESELEVQEARIQAESSDVKKEFDRVQRLTESYDGYVETSNYSQNDRELTQEATLRVPSTDFDTVLQKLKSSLDVNSFNVENYRIDVERSLDETSVLSQTLTDLESIKKRINRMDEPGEKIDLLMKYNDKRLDIVRQLRRYQRRLKESQQRSQLATIRLKLVQERPIEVRLWPDDAGRRWKRQLKEFLETGTNVVVETPAMVGIILLKLVQYVLYGITILLPLWLIYKIGRWLYG